MKREMLSIVILTAILTLSACAGPNGEAYGNNHGGVAMTDLLRIPLP